ncbi:MAG: hypothetical protein Q8941_15180 [Bacteroidota bacterium]|nr:hypothetical protein [Bacteroidota bacterium]
MKDTPKNEQEKSNRKPGETLKDKIHRHLNDINDIITEEDIRDSLTNKESPEKDSAKTKEITK